MPYINLTVKTNKQKKPQEAKLMLKKRNQSILQKINKPTRKTARKEQRKYKTMRKQLTKWQ